MMHGDADEVGRTGGADKDAACGHRAVRAAVSNAPARKAGSARRVKVNTATKARRETVCCTTKSSKSPIPFQRTQMGQWEGRDRTGNATTKMQRDQKRKGDMGETKRNRGRKEKKGKRIRMEVRGEGRKEGGLLSWYSGPSQPQRITSGLKTNFNLSPSYSVHNYDFTIRLLFSNHGSIYIHMNFGTQTQKGC